MTACNDIKLEVLLFCDYKGATASTIGDHIFAFDKFSKHNVHILNMVGDFPDDLNLNRFHVIIIHYSICVAFDYFISPVTRARIRDFSGLKVVYIQDDYRWIYNTLSALDYMKVDAIFGLANQQIVDQVYIQNRIPTVKRRETVLAGYVTDKLIGLPKKPYNQRTIDVGYRARKLSPWIGVHGQQKWKIADLFLKDAPNYNLICDISYNEDDRIYGDLWFDFLSNCKAVLGTESGASLCDFTGDIQKNVETHLNCYPNASFEEVRDLYFKDEDCKIMMNVISPRCFEAAALGTLMILYEGEYSGVLKPYRHYVPLAKDHSNMKEVVSYIRDQKRADEIIECAYNEVILNPEYNYSTMVKLFDNLVEEEIKSKTATVLTPYTRSEFEEITKFHLLKLKLAPFIESVIDKHFALSFAPEKNIKRKIVLSTCRKIIKPVLNPLYKAYLSVNRRTFFIKLKFFLTQKIRIFNPLLRRIRHYLLILAND